MPKVDEIQLQIPSDGVQLCATLHRPDTCKGLVVFVHGSGSSRHSPRNLFVAEQLEANGFTTLMFDLLTESENIDHANRFDMKLLAERLESAIRWIEHEPALRILPLGLFGASTGAAAALLLASRMGGRVAAVVSRGGRPDLAESSLHDVLAPSLFIVGSRDPEVLGLNRHAMSLLPEATPKTIAVVEGATHLFEEPGKLKEVADLAGRWLLRYASLETSMAAVSDAKVIGSLSASSPNSPAG